MRDNIFVPEHRTNVLPLRWLANYLFHPISIWFFRIGVKANEKLEDNYPEATLFDEIKEKLNDIQAKSKLILTTEKDAVRLIKYTEQLHNLPLYVLPIQHHFLFDAEPTFNALVKKYVTQYYTKINGN